MTHDLTDVELIFTEPCRGQPDEFGKLGTEWRVVGITGPPGAVDNYRVFATGEAIPMFELKAQLNSQLEGQT